MKIPDNRFVVYYQKFEKKIRVRPVSNVVLLACQTQFINYKHIRLQYKFAKPFLYFCVLFLATATLFN